MYCVCERWCIYVGCRCVVYVSMGVFVLYMEVRTVSVCTEQHGWGTLRAAKTTTTSTTTNNNKYHHQAYIKQEGLEAFPRG